MLISLNPIGSVHSTRQIAKDDHWDAEQSFIELDPSQFDETSLSGLAEFSHVEILFYMHQLDATKIETSARHPRNNSSWPKVGIFAQRAKSRPNQIGSTVCRISKVAGRHLFLDGLDAIDGTPVLDIKPWVAEFAPRGPVFQPSWITDLMQHYWA